MSVLPTLDNKIYALFVIVWFEVKAADVISTASSNVTVISNVPVSAIVASVQSIPMIDAEPNASARFFTQTNISGCASALSFPDAPRPGAKPQPPFTAIQCSFAPVEPAALLSTGKNFGLSAGAVVVPHKPIFFLPIHTNINIVLFIII